ncbi:polysaccharide deacetylase family protein [Lacisediminimonas profundi]|uniref:polysaccharide deacetylase family protein n=1 Tax=Lacisediminimonas profundi TaxID=2603856 RepID=UPI00124B0AB4|nr:polysaccharide deacetylase family protein [Lacisediminimonas profundi]
MPLLVLKIDVDTFRGTLEGVPNLVRLLRQHQAQATFLFSLGPDHTGWALRRAFRPGFFSKVSRTSVVEHYGLKTLSYGVLLPAPDIGKRCATEMRAVRDAGFECGVHTWDHVVWQDHVRNRDQPWTAAQMQKSWQRYTEIFGEAPRTHGAAGWQMNQHAFAQLDAFGLEYASDGREMLDQDGRLTRPDAGPYRLQANGTRLDCVQMPTTLPTLDELLGRTVAGTELTRDKVADFLLDLTAAPRDHVYTLHAELEGQKLAPIFDKLLAGWRAQGYTLASMEQYHRSLAIDALPLRPLQWGELPGRSGELVVA